MEKKYMVPDGMLEAARNGWSPVQDNALRTRLEAALKWLAENPIVPTARKIQEMSDSLTAQGDMYHSTEAYCEEWQRRMFLAPEPEVPEEIENLLWDKGYCGVNRDALIIEAYNRGRKAGQK